MRNSDQASRADVANFERHRGNFNPDAATGSIKIWLPVKP
jgi:hypothetical protein